MDKNSGRYEPNSIDDNKAFYRWPKTAYLHPEVDADHGQRLRLALHKHAYIGQKRGISLCNFTAIGFWQIMSATHCIIVSVYQASTAINCGVIDDIKSTA